MSLNAFLPAAVLDLLRRRPDRPVGVPETLRGTCLFADVAGFTSLSESLAGLGREGAEILTRLLNEFYTGVISILAPAGGDVMRFAGDAVTVFFPGADRETDAVEAARALQTMMADFQHVRTPAGEFGLGMKIGLASGECLLFLVGDEQGMDYVFAGRPVDLAAEAEHGASAGEIVFSGKEFRVPGSKFQVEESKRGFWRLAGAEPQLETRNSKLATPVPPLETRNSKLETPASAEADTLVEPFLHPRILDLYRHGSLHLANEHRRVAVVFIQAGGTIRLDRPRDLAALAEFYARAAQQCRRFDGHLNKIHCGDKGTMLLALFGAPVAHEDDSDRALEFALAVQGISAVTGPPLRIGVNRDRVFCGLVGSAARHEYTVMGDGVNVAARLMQAAHEGACLVSENVTRSAGPGFYFPDLPPMVFKGKRRPMPVARLQGRTGGRLDIPFFIGRDEERKRLLEAMEAHPADRPFLAWVEGEAGIGKSYFIQHLSQRHLPVEGRHHSRCQSYASSMAYYPFQKFLIEILHDLETGKDATAREMLVSVLAVKDPDMVPFAPLLFRLLNLSAPGDGEPALEPEIRRSVMWKIMRLIIEEALRQRERVWIIDNAQWMDEESLALMGHLLRMLDSNRLKVIVVSREAPSDETAPMAQRIVLPPFSDKEARTFAAAVLDVGDLPDEAMKKAWAVGRGNPLLMLESFRLMLKSGYLSRSEDFPEILMVDPSLESEMPESLAGIVLSQVDALPAPGKAALARLSVAGPNIPEALVRALGLDTGVLERLTVSGRFLRFNPATRNFFFTKQAYQQVLYESLEFAFRREAHRAIAAAIGTASRIPQADRAHLLAHHFGEAGDTRALPFLETIAREAKAAFALKEASAAYGRWIVLGGEAGLDVQEAVIEQAEVLLLLGKAGDAVKMLQEHLSRFSGSAVSAARRILAEAYRAQGAFALAEQHAAQAHAQAAHPRDEFLAACFLGKLYGQTGRLDQALKTMERIEHESKAFRNDPEYHMNRMRLAFVHYQKGMTDQAFKTFHRLAAWFKAHGQIKGSYTTLNNLAGIYQDAGRYDKAVGIFTVVDQILTTYGIWEAEIFLQLRMNIGLLYLNLGQFSKAHREFDQSLAYAKRYNSPLLYKAHYQAALLNLHQGRYADALQQIHLSLQACDAFAVAKNETCEIAMEAYLDLGARDLFEKTLEAYRGEIRDMKLEFLQASLANYEIEGALRFGGPPPDLNRIEHLFKAAIRQGMLPEAYRAARSLYLMTGNGVWLEKIGELLKSLNKKIFQAEFSLLSYQHEPDAGRRRKILRLLKEFPYAALALRAHQIMAKNAAGKRQRDMHEREARLLRQELYRGLPPELIPAEA